MQQAIAAYQRGDMREAEHLAQAIVSVESDHFDALHFLAIVSASQQRLDEALVRYDRALAVRPDDVEALNNRGITLRDLKRFDEALASYDRALAVRPTEPAVLNNRSVTLRALGRFDEALASYDRALAGRPDDADALNNRGITLQELERFDEALASYDRALSVRPSYAEALNNRGVTLEKLRRFDEALASYQRALAIRPDYAEALNNRGNALRELTRFDEALASYDRALVVRPDYAEVHYNRGLALQELQQFEEALASYDRAMVFRPHDAAVLNNRGNTLRELERFHEALASYNQALALRPDYADALNNRGVALEELRRFDDALASFDRALALQPFHPAVLKNRGNMLRELNRFDEALASFDCAIAAQPDYAEAHFSKSLVLLFLGNYEQGWQEYEWRKKLPPPLGLRDYEQPSWLGDENISGATIFLYREQGIGDTIQFCRYTKLLHDRGANVILEAPKPLFALFKTLEGVNELWQAGQSIPHFDYHCPLMSLPLAFRTTLANLPREIPYLFADKAKAGLWSKKLGPKSKMRVGLVWSGGHRPWHPEWHSNKRKNVPIVDLAPLRDVDVEFYSLQKGEPAESQFRKLRDSGWNGPNMIDLTRELTDFSDTAALIENLDLLISVCTSTAHLAGAMGKPVWLLSRFDIDWRWVPNSPWYPTVRIYQQGTVGDWNGVMKKVADDLARLASPGDLDTNRQSRQI